MFEADLHPVIAVDPGRMSGVALVLPSKSPAGRMYLTTRAIRVEPGVDGFRRVRDLYLDLGASVIAGGFKLSEVEVVVEIQHVRFAGPALVVTEVRTLWEVYAFEAFGCLPYRVQPAEWRSGYGINHREKGAKKAAAEVVLSGILTSPESKVFEAIAAPNRRRTADEVEAALIALHQMGVGYG